MSAGVHDARVSNDLAQLAPAFRAAVEKAIRECNAAGLDAYVYEAFRSQALQALYYKRGRDVKPPLVPVTNAPTNLQSWHGYGLAVDVISKSKGWNAGTPWFRQVAEIFKRNDCKWGGDWTKPDLPHFQWHLCRPSPSDEARALIASEGVGAVWRAVSADASAGNGGAPAVRAEPAWRPGTVTASELNLRPDASTTKPPLRKLVRGTPLRVLEPHGSWFRVSVDGVEGFVHGDHIALRDHTFTAGFLAGDDALRRVPLPATPPIPPPSGGTARAVASTWNRFGGLLAQLSARIRIKPASAVAVLCVESGGAGFGQDGRMIIRFETHIFHKFWGRNNRAAFDARFRFDADKPWTKQQFNDAGTWRDFHGKQTGEWAAFDLACTLDRPAALRSISMGSPQIMGFNHGSIGYDSVEAMFDAFGADDRWQILGMFDFIKGPGSGSPMVQALQQENYEAFAVRYNGSGQAAEYGARIRVHADAFEALGASV